MTNEENLKGYEGPVSRLKKLGTMCLAQSYTSIIGSVLGLSDNLGE